MKESLIFMFAAFGLLVSNTIGAQIDTYTVQEAYVLTIESVDDPNFVILDVRTASEYNPQHLEGAINRDFYDDNFEQMLLDLDTAKTYLIHCQSGYRSSLTYAMMQDMDFVSFYDMLGGIAAWNSGSYPTTADFAPDFLSYSDTLISFGDVLVGESNSLEITVTNANNSILEFVSASDLSGTNFSSNFDDSSNLEGADNYTFEIVYTPTVDGQDNTTMTIESNGGALDYYLDGSGVTLINVEENLSNEFQIFPNPVRSELTIRNSGSKVILWVEVFSKEGKLVCREDGFESNFIDLSGLDNGNYLIHFGFHDSVLTKSIVLIH